MKNNSGFTLIELMIVVAIVGILAAVAIPAYQDHVAKTQVAEAVTLAEALKKGVVEYYANSGEVPSVTDFSSSYSGKYVSSMTIFGAGPQIVVMATMSATDVSPNLVSRTYAVASNDSGLSWSCGSASALAASNTTIDDEFLPTACK